MTKAEEAPEIVSLVRVSYLPTEGECSDPASFKKYVEVQSQLIESPFSLNAALRKLAPKKLELLEGLEDPVDWLVAEIHVDGGDSEFIRVSMQGDQVDQRIQILNEVVAAYLAESSNQVRTERSKKIQAVRERARKLTNTIKDKFEYAERISDEVGTAEALAANHQRIQHQIELEHERIKNLSLKLDDLVIAAKTTSDDAVQKQIASEKAAVSELLQAATEKYASHVDEFSKPKPFSADLEMLHLEIEQLKQQLRLALSEAGSLNAKLSSPARISLVQPAVVVEADQDDEDDNSSESARRLTSA